MTQTPLLLLHGALGAAGQFAPLAALLNERLTVHTLDFEGHGARPLAGRSFHLAAFADNVLNYLDAQGIASADLFGYSMGGFVACLAALAQPERVRRIATLATKYEWNPSIAAREAAMLDIEQMRAKVPAFVATLAARHSGAGWEVVVNETRAMLLALGESGGFSPAQAAQLNLPVRIMLGDRDRTVSLAESVAIFQALPGGELELLPRTPHPLERVSPTRLAHSLTEFFGE